MRLTKIMKTKDILEKKTTAQKKNLSRSYFSIKKSSHKPRVELKKVKVKSKIDSKLLDKVITEVIKNRKIKLAQENKCFSA